LNLEVTVENLAPVSTRKLLAKDKPDLRKNIEAKVVNTK
jgi:hypothetical protein